MSSRLATLEEINQLLSSVIALNGQHWTDGNGNDVTGRQHGGTTTTVPMDFVYKDQAALTTALVQKLSPFGNVVKTSTRVDGQDIDPASLTALQDVTGIYGLKSNPNKPTQSTKLLNRFNQPIQALPNLQFQYNQPNLFSQQSWYN